MGAASHHHVDSRGRMIAFFLLVILLLAVIGPAVGPLDGKSTALHYSGALVLLDSLLVLVVLYRGIRGSHGH